MPFTKRSGRLLYLIGAILAFVLTLAALKIYEGPTHTARAPANVLLITVDTLRADHMGIYGYPRKTTPRLDTWFKKGLVFENAFAAEAATGPSVVSILSGLYPHRHGIRFHYQKIAPSLELVSDVLRRKGYHTAGIVSNMVLTAEACRLDEHFDYFDDFVDESESNRAVYERGAKATTDAALHWLKNAYDPQKKFFLWIHYQDPHGPYQPPSDKPRTFTHSGEQKIDMSKVHSYQRIPGIDDGLSYIDRYDEEIAYMDDEVGRLLDRFSEQGILDNTLFIFGADHGETMIEHELYFTHGYHVYNSIIRVPLLISGMRGKTGRIQENVSNTDIASTIYRITGTEPSYAPSGAGLLDRIVDKPVFSEANWDNFSRKCMIYGKTKWFLEIRRPMESQGEDGRIWEGEKKVFNLRLDPTETSPSPGAAAFRLYAGRTEIFKKHVLEDSIPAKSAKKKMINGIKITSPKIRPQDIPEDRLEQLRTLGYVD